MNIFNRRELYITRRLPDLNRVLECLSTNSIQYMTKTNTITNPGRSHGVPFIGADYTYEYRVYVHKNDYDKAKQAVSR